MSIPISTNEKVVSENVESNSYLSNFAFLTAVIIAVCYWHVDHNWDASRSAFSMSEAHTGAENETADRMSQVNPKSTACRIILATWGCVCFLTSWNTRVRFSSPLIWSISALAMFLLASVMWSANPPQTMYKLAVLLTMSIAAGGVACRFDLREILSIVVLVCGVFIFVGVFAEVSHGYSSFSNSYRFIGTTHPNTEAIYASMLCIIARIYLSRIGQSNFWGIGVFVLGLLAVWFTKSRTALAGLLLSLLLVQVLVVRGTNRLLLILGGLFLAVLLVVASSVISQKSSGILGRFATMGRQDDVSTLSGRLPLWEELLLSINKSPVIGYGYLSYWDAKRVETLSDRFRWVIPHGHNAYLDTMLDGGAIGLVLLILAIVSAFGDSAKLFSKTNRIEYAVVFGLVAYAVLNGFAESLFKLPGFPLFVILTCCFNMIARGAMESSEAAPSSVKSKRKPIRMSGLKSRQHVR